MQNTDPQKAFRDRVAKIKTRKSGDVDYFAPEMLDDPFDDVAESEKRKTGTPTLLRLIAISLAATSVMITEFPDKFGVAELFAESASAATSTTHSETAALK